MNIFTVSPKGLQLHFCIWKAIGHLVLLNWKTLPTWLIVVVYLAINNK
jgi:hypothetical protein